MKQHVGMESPKSNQTSRSNITILLRIAITTSFDIFLIKHTPQFPTKCHTSHIHLYCRLQLFLKFYILGTCYRFS